MQFWFAVIALRGSSDRGQAYRKWTKYDEYVHREICIGNRKHMWYFITITRNQIWAVRERFLETDRGIQAFHLLFVFGFEFLLLYIMTRYPMSTRVCQMPISEIWFSFLDSQIGSEIRLPHAKKGLNLSTFCNFQRIFLHQKGFPIRSFSTYIDPMQILSDHESKRNSV